MYPIKVKKNKKKLASGVNQGMVCIDTMNLNSRISSHGNGFKKSSQKNNPGVVYNIMRNAYRQEQPRIWAGAL